MRKSILAAFGAAALLYATPSISQDYPFDNGNYWNVQAVTVDDGHLGDYADYLAVTLRKNYNWQVSKGWIKGYHILSNINKRADEPDLYIVTIFDHVPTPAEDKAREKESNAFLATNARKEDAQSGARAKYRKLGSSSLLQEMLFKR